MVRSGDWNLAEKHVLGICNSRGDDGDGDFDMLEGDCMEIEQLLEDAVTLKWGLLFPI